MLSFAAAPKIVLAAGGTGGHVFPAAALAKALIARGAEVVLMTDARGGVYQGVPTGVEIHRIRSKGFAGKGFLGRLTSIPQLGVGVLQARALLGRIKPRLAVGFGGYASLPPLVAANWLGIPTVVHEQNAILGRANRLLAKKAKGIAISFAKTGMIPDGSENRVRHVGMPVRDSVLSARNVDYPTITDEGPIRILIMGGSQGARVLSEVAPTALNGLPEHLKARLSVVQQCRPEDLDGVRAAYAESGVRAELSVFFDDIPERMAACHLIIARSGASSTAEALAIGRPAVLVPYRFAIDDHQSANAHAVDDCGAGWLMEQESFDADALAERLVGLFSLPKTLLLAASNAKRNGRPDAAERLADMVFDLIGADGNGKDTDNPDKTNNEEAA